MEAEMPTMEADHEEETAVRIKAEKELKKREKDAAGAKRMKERFAEVCFNYTYVKPHVLHFSRKACVYCTPESCNPHFQRARARALSLSLALTSPQP